MYKRQPYSGTIVNLADGSFEYEAVPVPVEKKTKPASGIYARLLAAAQRLLDIVKKLSLIHIFLRSIAHFYYIIFRKPVALPAGGVLYSV